MLGRTDSRLRLVLLLLVVAVGAGALGLRLAYWQIGVGPELQRMADSQLEQPTVADVERGQIVDRRGTVLARTAYRDLLAAYPDVMQRREMVIQTAAGLSLILGYEVDRRLELLADLSSGDRYFPVEERLTPEQSDLVRKGLEHGLLGALKLESHPVRFYPSAGGAPETTLASQLLGFVTDDGQGRYGIEQSSDELLAGSGGATANVVGAEDVPRTGGHVQLTIDASLQLALENELQAAYVADRANRVSGVIMDPYTGAILAWASVPGYDANNYGRTANRAPQMFTDPILSEVYEPGSVMKMFTAAAAIEKGVVGPLTLVQDSKNLFLGDNVVRNFDRRSMGVVPFEDAIAHSRNVATGRVALELGQTTEEASAVLYDMWQRLGIGKPTGIELANEAEGIDHPPAEGEWLRIDLVNRAFGQSVAVTPLQLVNSFAAMVNGGLLPTPHVYAALNGELQTAPAATRVITEELSATLRDMMVHVAETGPHYAEETLIPGYVVGGKTGTAQIWDAESSSWLENVYNHTFVGFVGAERPEAVILVRVHDTEPHVQHRWGLGLQMTTNQLFKRVAQATISALDIEPLPGALPAQPDSEPSPDPRDSREPRPQADPTTEPRTDRPVEAAATRRHRRARRDARIAGRG